MISKRSSKMVFFKCMLLFTVLTSSFTHCAVRKTITPLVLVHGGAGNIQDSKIPSVMHGVKLAARAGYNALQANGGNVLDAVEQAVRLMEANVEFNAGNGSVLTWEGEVEADASIMNGADLAGGCVSLVKNILHPISVARSVMEKSQHTYIAGEGLMKFAAENGFEILPDGALVTDDARHALELYKNSTASGSPSDESDDFGSAGTVGAVAIDSEGNLSAATSTGGLIGKLPGRIGDSPIIGAGTYAENNVGAVSATGHGESIMQYNLASRILRLVELEGMSAQAASQIALEEMTRRLNHVAGVISIDATGGVGISFTSKRMAWAYQQDDVLHFGIDKDEDNFEIIGEPKI